MIAIFDYEYWGNETLPAATNMALEEFFLRRAAIRHAASVRFFSVPKDAVVIGYAQDTDAIKKADDSFDVTRRLTGGSHVQIGPNTLAYSFAVPRNGAFSSYGDMRAYYADLVADALAGMGIENIDADNSASTINVNGKVVASHAIIWGVESALLHGLMIISPYDAGKINERVFLGKRKIRGKLYSEYSALKNIPAVTTLLGSAGGAEEERMRILKGAVAKSILHEVTNGKFRKMKIGASESNGLSEIEKSRYEHGEWLKKRKPPFTQEEVEEIPGEELDGKLKKNLGYCLYAQVKDKDFRKMSIPEEP